MLSIVAMACLAVGAPLAPAGTPASKEAVRMNVWPGLAPGETVQSAPKVVDGREVPAITDVTHPELTWYPAAGPGPHPAVVVCPGGGYAILAQVHEGTEIAHWLNTVGFTAAVLHYRVPGKRDGALQDAQRAVSLVRHQAAKRGIDPARIGVLGFSAGAHLCARLGVTFDKRAYPPVDAVDKVSCRPDFTVLVYPAYLMDGPGKTVSPDVAPRADTPPTFLIQTEDDPILCAPGYSQALSAAWVPNRCVMYPRGGHGYGLRVDAAKPLHEWPARAAEWLREIAHPGQLLSMRLWPGKAPLATGEGPADTPDIALYRPDPAKATGAAVVVCPGGGYQALMMTYEGHDIARWLVGQGIAAVVLKYRLKPYPASVSRLDGMRAVRLVRANARKWGINPGRIGMMGFSAGGHLTANVGTTADPGDPGATDPIERINSRPDFMILVYPAINYVDIDTGARVTASTPPAFLTHALTDQVVPASATAAFAASLKACGVASEYFELPTGEHGLGCGVGELWEKWQARASAWLQGRGLANPVGK